MLLTQFLAAEGINILETLRDAFSSMGEDIINFVPKVAVALILFFVGATFALVISKIIRGACKKAKLDDLFRNSNLGKQLGGKDVSLGGIVSKATYYLIILFVLRAAASSLGMESITSLLERIFDFLPKALVALVIAAIGLTIADIAKRGITTALTRFGVDYAAPVGNIAFAFVLVLALSSALAQLGVDAQLLEASVIIVISGFCLALAIGFGLGMKEASAGLIAGIYARDIFKPGSKVSIDGEQCNILGIGPLTAKLEKEDGTPVIIPNTALTSDKIIGTKS